MAETYKVKLVGGNADSIDAEFLLNESREGCELRLRFLNRELAGTASDYFEALCRIREQLEPLDLRPYCYGASRNVFPSGMGRNMGAGLQAYKMELGEEAGLEDLVFIFAHGDDVEPVTVAEQRAFFEEWLESIP